jgi:hypothetical protein
MAVPAGTENRSRNTVTDDSVYSPPRSMVTDAGVAPAGIRASCDVAAAGAVS